MSVESILARARRRNTDVMSDTVVITRGSGGGTYNSGTGQYTPGTGSPVYTGPGIVHAEPGEAQNEDGTVVSWTYIVEVPAGTGVQRGDRVRVTASTFEPGLVGVSVWAVWCPGDEWSTRQVVRCVDQVPGVRA